jgi:hypothetical protein
MCVQCAAVGDVGCTEGEVRQRFGAQPLLKKPIRDVAATAAAAVASFLQGRQGLQPMLARERESSSFSGYGYGAQG